jgi:hypothetical protein
MACPMIFAAGTVTLVSEAVIALATSSSLLR